MAADRVRKSIHKRRLAVTMTLSLFSRFQRPLHRRLCGERSAYCVTAAIARNSRIDSRPDRRRYARLLSSHREWPRGCCAQERDELASVNSDYRHRRD
jgi:hypothetical protein